jgi:hypothetical protein
MLFKEEPVKILEFESIIMIMKNSLECLKSGIEPTDKRIN